jgi:hypothetical protein
MSFIKVDFPEPGLPLIHKMPFPFRNQSVTLMLSLLYT